MERLLLIIFLLFSLVSCQSEGEGEGQNSDPAVTINTKGIFDPVQFSVVGPKHIGNYLVGAEDVIVTLTLKNTGMYDATNINIELSEEVSAGMDFAPNENNESSFPGKGGNCKRRLRAREQCQVKLMYRPFLEGAFKQGVKLSYRNLVNPVKKELELSVLTGQPAELIFTNDITRYDLGVVERTFKDDFYEQEFEVKNVGGLPARDLNINLESSPDSGAYKIVENDCPESLGLDQVCRVLVRFQSQNYDASAPDGDTDLLAYSTTLRFDFIRDTQEGRASLNGRLEVLSTTIQAILESSGLESISFNELVVGNFKSKTFRISNVGFKEAILRGLHIRNSGVRTATCVKTNDTGFLECRDPNDVSNPASSLSLAEFPFRFEDVTGCMNDLSDTDYTRLPSGELSKDVRYIRNETPSSPGETCTFKVYFHPSVEYKSDGDWSNQDLIFEYDSTWKDGIVLHGDEVSDDRFFNIAEAAYRSAAKIETSRLRFNKSAMSDLQTGDDFIYDYDLGRITLISTSSLQSSIDFRIINRGGDEAEILSIKDGDGNIVTNEKQDFNNYYRSVNHDSCNILARNDAGFCNVRMKLTPLASTASGPLAEQQENDSMFDVIEGNNRYKKFIITYDDGTTYEDDMSDRAPREVEVWIRALLVRKGFLVYDEDNIEGLLANILSGDVGEFSFAIENIGTGSIPYISFLPELDLEGSFPKSQGRAYPFKIVPKPASQVNSDTSLNVDKDCSNFISDHQAGLPQAIVDGSLASGVLGAGESCAFTVSSRLRNTDVTPPEHYFYDEEGDNDGGPNPAGPEWQRLIWDDPAIADQKNWELGASTYNTEVHFRYLDGDGLSDPANGYNPDIEGYGNLHTIGLPGDSNYQINIRFDEIAKVVPDTPRPLASALIYRPEVQLPTIPVDGWGNSVPGESIPELLNYIGHDSTSNNMALSAHKSESHLKGQNIISQVDSNQAYYLHFGTFPVGTTYDFSVELSNKGTKGASIDQLSWNQSGGNNSLVLDDGEITFSDDPLKISAYGSEKIDFSFSASVPGGEGIHWGSLEYSYLTGRTDPVSGDPERYTATIIVVAEGISSTHGRPKLTAQDILVEYNEFATPQYTESSLGSSYDVTTILDGTPPEPQALLFRAVRGGAIYVKKTFTIENPHPEPIRDLRFFIKDSFFADRIKNQSSARDNGYKRINKDCDGVVLNQGDSCSFDIEFKASESETQERMAVGVLSYRWSSANQYVNEGFNLNFTAVNPAILDIVGVNSLTVLDEVGNNIPNNFPIDFGSWTGWNARPKVLENDPTIFEPNTALRVRNTSDEKASFLSQYRDFKGNKSAHPPHGQAWTVIYNKNKLKVEANRVCFYGDDEADAGVPDEEKGFNQDSSNQCLLKPYYSAGNEYVGEYIEVPENVHFIKFYNSQRSSTDTLGLHIRGFIEGNRSYASSGHGYFNVGAYDDGSVSFSWNELSPTSPSLGSVEGYRVFYSERIRPVNNIFTSEAVDYVDVSSPNVTLTGLNPMSFYYIRVAAIRNMNGKQYISRVKNWDRLSVIVPDENHFYDHDSGSLITKRLAPSGEIPFVGSKVEAKQYCNARRLRVARNGQNKNRSMQMIGGNQYDAILEDPSYTIDDRPLEVRPLWMSDNPIAIEPIFGTEVLTSMNGNDGNMFYIKPCMNCNSLSLIEGGDGADFPPGTRLFIGGDAYSAAARCYIKKW